MGLFEYVIVLTSIVIGLSLTHLMQGVAGLVQHPGRARIWWVHLVWVAHLLLTTVFWWWWEFRLHTIKTWTFGLYAFFLGYAFFIYLICSVLFPHDLGEYDGFKAYFMARRRWFFGMLIAWLAVDVADTLTKGLGYFASLGIEYPIAQAGLALLCLVGLISRREAVQGAVAILVFGYQVSRVFRYYNTVS